MSNRMKRYCRYHCRTCGCHFVSLEAFDAHQPRNPKDGGCYWPDDADLVEQLGECRISDPPSVLKRVAVHTTVRSVSHPERFSSR
jgi:hypothetical protein